MSQAPELVEAYRMIKNGQRQAAGQMLKSYLATHPRDVDAWWLMAHAVGKQDNVERCLESILKIDPNHSKAREKLEKLRGGSTIQVVQQHDLTPGFTMSPPPFDPFAQVDTAGKVDPFASVKAEDEIPDPFADLGQPVVQAPGSGNQPNWGPGLAFVQETAGSMPTGTLPGAKVPKPRGPADSFSPMNAAPKSSSNVETIIGIAVIGIALIVVVGLGLWLANDKGWLNLEKNPKGKVAKLEELNDLQFTMKYPDGWDARCAFEQGGYRVCGVANHELYNEVDYYSREGGNIGQLLAEGISGMWGDAEDLPDTVVSVIAMDVPQSSPSYYSKSLAKTKWEWAQSGWDLYGTTGNSTYEAKDITVDGMAARYYKFVSTDRDFPNAAFDVYIPRDNGMMFWMTISVYGKMGNEITEATIDEIVNSIHLKPTEEWSSSN
ncbi:MAG TPA: hypothetical protein VHP83_20370 [Aggregatilineaceae bacterium]|nr:hypothetical protein [Aggregatilineaceae bacterium]